MYNTNITIIIISIIYNNLSKYFSQFLLYSLRLISVNINKYKYPIHINT